MPATLTDSHNILSNSGLGNVHSSMMSLVLHMCFSGKIYHVTVCNLTPSPPCFAATEEGFHGCADCCYSNFRRHCNSDRVLWLTFRCTPVYTVVVGLSDGGRRSTRNEFSIPSAQCQCWHDGWPTLKKRRSKPNSKISSRSTAGRLLPLCAELVRRLGGSNNCSNDRCLPGVIWWTE